jgi:hypothetical protein
MQGADTALPAGDRDLMYSVISRPDYLKGTGSGFHRYETVFVKRPTRCGEAHCNEPLAIKQQKRKWERRRLCLGETSSTFGRTQLKKRGKGRDVHRSAVTRLV